jgi:hypothetical protein
MRSRTTLTAAALLAVGALLGWLGASGHAPERLHAQDKARDKVQPAAARYDELAKLPFPSGYPTKASAATLRDELLFQRATQVYLWALPLINTLGMKDGSEQKFGAGYNVLPIWKDRLDAKTLVTTPNSDVLYAMSYADLGETGPLVFDAPPRMQGIFLDFWQRPIPGPKLDATKDFAGDVGFFGPDGGKGGKFLLLPPGYSAVVPDGYYVFRSGTNNVFIFLRAFYEDPKNLASAVELLEKARIYPLGQERTAQAMKFPNASGVAVNMLPRSDATAFDQLKHLIDREPDSIAGEDWRGMLAAIGIERGKPFDPDAATRKTLDRAAETGYKMSRVLGFESTVGGVDYRIYPDRRWLNPFASGYPFDLAWTRIPAGYRALDNRINFFTNYYSVSPGMLSKTPGVGANYLMGFVDSAGSPLHGTKVYTLHLPPKIPAANFWSLTLYDAANSSGLDNGQPFPSLGSRDKPERERDGSTVLYLGPQAPEGKRGNWLRTVPDKGYFVILRLYGPLEAAINGTWKPGDLEPAR